jgi:ribosome recycling factor
MSKHVDEALVGFDSKMGHTVEVLLQEFQGVRTSRASANLLDTLKVEAYGSLVPIQQVGTVSAPDARTLVVQVWSKDTVRGVEKAIRDSDLGLNPSVDGQIIRLPMPPLSEERRQELVKVVAKYAEEAKVAVRNIRRDAMEAVKKMEKNDEITEDDLHRLNSEIQKITDSHVSSIEDALEKKRKDIMTI